MKPILFKEMLMLSLLVICACSDSNKSKTIPKEKKTTVSKEYKEVQKARQEYYLCEKTEQTEKIKKRIDKLDINIDALKKQFSNAINKSLLEQTILLEKKKERLKQILIKAENLDESKWPVIKKEIDRALNETEKEALTKIKKEE